MLMLSFLIAFLAAALSGMGIGGGGIYILYLTLILNMQSAQARGINLAFFIVAALSSLAIHLKKRKICIPLVLITALGGITGALLGAHLSHIMNETLLQKAFGGFLVFCGLRSFFIKK